MQRTRHVQCLKSESILDRIREFSYFLFGVLLSIPLVKYFLGMSVSHEAATANYELFTKNFFKARSLLTSAVNADENRKYLYTLNYSILFSTSNDSGKTRPLWKSNC
jgi:hypothetical protein